MCTNNIIENMITYRSKQRKSGYIVILMTNTLYTYIYLYRVTKPNCMLCLGEFWHCTSPGLRLASHTDDRCLPRASTSGVLFQRTGTRPMGKSLPGFKTPVPIALHSKRDAFTSKDITLGVIRLVLSLLCQ